MAGRDATLRFLRSHGLLPPPSADELAAAAEGRDDTDAAGLMAGAMRAFRHLLTPSPPSHAVFHAFSHLLSLPYIPIGAMRAFRQKPKLDYARKPVVAGLQGRSTLRLRPV